MVYDPAIQAIGNMAGPLILVGVFVFVLLLVYAMVNSRYPRIKFHVIEGKRQITTYRRQLGEKVVEDNIIRILMNGQKMLGFSISEYDYYFVGDKSRTYLATRRGTELVPLRLKEYEIELAELGTAREIAIRYVNTIDSVNRDLDKQNPIILVLISMIPVAVLVLLTGLMFYLMLSDALPKLVKANVDMARYLAESSGNTKVIVDFINLHNLVPTPPPSANITNITIPR